MASSEDMLCDAAVRGSTRILDYIIDREGYHIFDKVLAGTFKGKNPLHVAISAGKTSFVLKLLQIQPDLVDVVNAELRTALHVACKSAVADIEIVKRLLEIRAEMCIACDRDGNNPLHIAAMKLAELNIESIELEKNIEVVKLLLETGPEMCIALNRDGNNPLHIAAMQGKVKLLGEMVRTCPQAARVLGDRGVSILHLCVRYNQVWSLQLLLQNFEHRELVNSVDANGDNILHMAVFGRRYEIIAEVIYSGIDVNARNGSELTAMDIHIALSKRENTRRENTDITKLLSDFKAKERRQLFLPVEPSWQHKKKETLMVVSSLIATMAFQVGLNPPGGCWQDTSTEHVAGKAINAYYYPYSYGFLMYFNTVGFLLSLTTILLLITTLPAENKVFGWIRLMISWMTIMTTALAYTFSVIFVSPNAKQEAFRIAILVTVPVWAVMISIYVQQDSVQSIRGYLRAAQERHAARNSERIHEIGNAPPVVDTQQ